MYVPAWRRRPSGRTRRQPTIPTSGAAWAVSRSASSQPSWWISTSLFRRTTSASGGAAAIPALFPRTYPRFVPFVTTRTQGISRRRCGVSSVEPLSTTRTSACVRSVCAFRVSRQRRVRSQRFQQRTTTVVRRGAGEVKGSPAGGGASREAPSRTRRPHAPSRSYRSSVRAGTATRRRRRRRGRARAPPRAAGRRPPARGPPRGRARDRAAPRLPPSGARARRRRSPLPAREAAQRLDDAPRQRRLHGRDVRLGLLGAVLQRYAAGLKLGDAVRESLHLVLEALRRREGHLALVPSLLDAGRDPLFVGNAGVHGGSIGGPAGRLPAPDGRRHARLRLFPPRASLRGGGARAVGLPPLRLRARVPGHQGPLQALRPRRRLDDAEPAHGDGRLHARLFEVPTPRDPQLSRVLPFGDALLDVLLPGHEPRRLPHDGRPRDREPHLHPALRVRRVGRPRRTREPPAEPHPVRAHRSRDGPSRAVDVAFPSCVARHRDPLHRGRRPRRVHARPAVRRRPRHVPGGPLAVVLPNADRLRPIVRAALVALGPPVQPDDVPRRDLPGAPLQRLAARPEYARLRGPRGRGFARRRLALLLLEGRGVWPPELSPPSRSRASPCATASPPSRSARSRSTRSAGSRAGWTTASSSPFARSRSPSSRASVWGSSGRTARARARSSASSRACAARARAASSCAGASRPSSSSASASTAS